MCHPCRLDSVRNLYTAGVDLQWGLHFLLVRRVFNLVMFVIMQILYSIEACHRRGRLGSYCCRGFNLKEWPSKICMILHRTWCWIYNSVIVFFFFLFEMVIYMPDLLWISLWGIFWIYDQYWGECLRSSTGNISTPRFLPMFKFCSLLDFTPLAALMFYWPSLTSVGNRNLWQAGQGRTWTCFQGLNFSHILLSHAFSFLVNLQWKHGLWISSCPSISLQFSFYPAIWMIFSYLLCIHRWYGCLAINLLNSVHFAVHWKYTWGWTCWSWASLTSSKLALWQLSAAPFGNWFCFTWAMLLL